MPPPRLCGNPVKIAAFFKDMGAIMVSAYTLNRGYAVDLANENLSRANRVFQKVKARELRKFPVPTLPELAAKSKSFRDVWARRNWAAQEHSNLIDLWHRSWKE